MRLSTFAVAFLLSRTALAAPVLVLDDPLTAAKGAGQTVNGGTFSAAGWTRDTFQAQLVYDLGTPVTAGRVTFEMDGVNGFDHGKGGFPDCRAIFAAVDNNGSGDIDDPATNPSVQFVWAWAMEETDYCNGGPGGFERTNKMKLLVHGNTPNLGDEPGEPMSDPLSWDIATFYAYEIGWDQNHAWLLRDGAMVLDQVYPAAPVIMNMRYVFLGTVHRYDAGVKNATFRNLKVWDDGGPTQPPVDDAGTCLKAGPLVPASAGGLSGDLSVVYSHCEGAGAFRIVQLWVGDEVASGADAVSVSYEAGLLRLDGSPEACAPGESAVLSSAHGSLDCAKTTVTTAGNELSVSWSLAFDAASFSGTHAVYVDAKGGTGTPEPRLGWTQLGSFNVSSSWTDGGGIDPSGDAGNASRGATETDDSGCGCRAARTNAGGSVAFLLALVLYRARRRRAH